MTTININLDFETLTHELRTPLAGILGMTEIMEEENLPPYIKEQVALIHSAGKRLVFIVNQILTCTDIKAHIRN
jgi:signal transduction histidine kinase